MEHKLDELQSQQRQLSQSNLSKPNEVADLQHEVMQLTAANEASAGGVASSHVALVLHCVNAVRLLLHAANANRQQML